MKPGVWRARSRLFGLGSVLTGPTAEQGAGDLSSAYWIVHQCDGAGHLNYCCFQAAGIEFPECHASSLLRPLHEIVEFPQRQ